MAESKIDFAKEPERAKKYISEFLNNWRPIMGDVWVDNNVEKEYFDFLKVGTEWDKLTIKSNMVALLFKELPGFLEKRLEQMDAHIKEKVLETIIEVNGGEMPK